MLRNISESFRREAERRDKLWVITLVEESKAMQVMGFRFDHLQGGVIEDTVRSYSGGILDEMEVLC